MRNPWLEVPLADYEAHMALPQVGQAQMLAETLSSNIEKFAPRSVAILGCAGGNGFEQIPASVERVVGIDINPAYIEQAQVRSREWERQPELFVGDVQRDGFAFAPVGLLFAGLLFEYVDVASVLERSRSMLCHGGTLVTVLQLPNEATVSPSPYATVGTLASIFSFVPPDEFRQLAGDAGYQPLGAKTVKAKSGKKFHVQSFRLRSANHR